MLDPYDDATLYDLEYQDYVEDVAFYVDRARNAGGPVLELGCGTGRLTVTLARSGAQVWGVDRSAAMLAALAGKRATEDPAVARRIVTHRADYLADPLNVPGWPATFRVILWPFNALHHCRDEAEVVAALSRFAGHLDDGGRLALDCYLPDRELYAREPDKRYEERTFDHPQTGETLSSWEEGWWDEERRQHHVIYVYQWPDGAERRTHLVLRMFELHELYRAFDAAGFRIVREASDFRGAPLTTGALKWVGVLARKG